MHSRQNRTKIVCTIGPASQSAQVIRRMILAGADVFRLNFSHGTHEQHETALNTIREASHELARPLAILGDLSGPKLRIGDIEAGSAELSENDLVTLTSEPGHIGRKNRFSVNFPGFHRVAKPGEHILLDDGNLQLAVERVSRRNVVCRVLNGGVLKPRKGVNLPDTKLPIPALTEKDRTDMAFALDAGVDALALSFVRSPEDIRQAKEAMRAFGREVPIFAKIEKKDAVDHLPEILHEADGAMVARGDLGIEIPMEQVPGVQKRVILACNRAAKPVITATQMLESMILNPRPTRAEVADIYTAIHDGTDAIMLSAETAIGTYPIRAVEVMDTVAMEAEKHMPCNRGLRWILSEGEAPSLTLAICNSAVRLAEALRLDLILVPTQTGFSAMNLARFKPSMPIYAFSTEPATVNLLCTAWGVSSRIMAPLRDEDVARSQTDALIAEVVRSARHYGFARAGNRAVILGGVPLGKTRTTNYLQVVEIE